VIYQSKNNNSELSGYYLIAFSLSAILIYSLNTVLASYQIYSLMEILFFSILVLAAYRKTQFRLKVISINEVYKIYKSSFYNGSSQTVVTLYSKTDLLFIEKLSSAINLAYYGFFTRVIDPLMMVASALAISAYSFFSRYINSEEKATIAPKLRQYLVVAFVYSLLILAAITFMLPVLLQTVKSRYQITSSLAFFFGLATAIRIISAAQGAILLSMGKFRYTFKIAIINVLSLFPMYFLLIPELNLRGVLTSIIISEMICVLIKAKTLMKVIF